MMTYQELLKGSKTFVDNEERDAMYKVATYLVEKFWGIPRDITDGLGVLLLTWNQSLYRYGSFDFDSLEKCLTEDLTILQQFRKRDIFSYNAKDSNTIGVLFNDMLRALQTPNGSKSPVAASKALHLLAPSFFPLWDNKIADAYHCLWDASDVSLTKYLQFMTKSLQIAEDVVQSYIQTNSVDRQTAIQTICKEGSTNLPFTKSLLKIIDEYNYARYTKGWI